MKEKVLSFLTLFTSLSTLVCCALPALFVTLGLGAAFAGLVTRLPQLIWMSEHKTIVFGAGAFFLAMGAVMQWQTHNAPCPIDPELAEACRSTRRWSLKLYVASVCIYLVGAFFAFGASHFQ